MKRQKAVDVSRTGLPHHGSVPRDVWLTANGRTLMVFAMVFAVGAVTAAIALPIVRASQLSARARLTAEATPATATIVRVTITKGDDPRRDVTYRYSVNSEDYEHTVQFPRRGRAFKEGGEIAILYARSQPARSWLPGHEPGAIPVVLLPLVPGALLLVGGLLTLPVRRERALLAEGRFAQARVLASKKVQHQHHHTFQVRYEFTTLSGATVTGKSDRGRKGTTSGDVIPIVYHRDNPQRNAVYPLSLVTPDHP